VKRILTIGVFVVVIVIACGLLAQIIPYGRSHTNPPVVSEPTWDNPQTRALAQRACFDCHSNETVWPWYTNVAPVSWLIQHDVDEGRQRLNFSEWGNANPRALNELGEVIQRGSMPPAQYTIIHTNAVLSDAEKQQLITGLQASLK
jgi:cytochrome c551/c552